jgi:hypothetical protein
MKATELEVNQGKIGAGVEHCNPVPHAEATHLLTTPQDWAADVLHSALKEVMLKETIRATEDRYGDQELETVYCVTENMNPRRWWTPAGGCHCHWIVDQLCLSCTAQEPSM